MTVLASKFVKTSHNLSFYPRGRDYLEQDVRGVMKQHDQGADAKVVGTVGETEQEDGGQMVDDLFFKVLAKQTYVEYVLGEIKWPSYVNRRI